MIRKIVYSLFVVAVMTTGGLGAYHLTKSNTRDSDGRLSVVASYYPLYDFARQVGGDKIEVINMTPAGTEPHDYDPPAKALVGAHGSSVFIYNGGQMEPWVDGFLQDYKNVIVKTSNNIDLREAEDDHHRHHGHHDSHDHESVVSDPHFWLDPVLAQQIVDNIRDGLVRADPDNRDYYWSNAEIYNQKLIKLDQSFAEALASCKLDTAISSHSAFSYLASRYKFNVSSIAGIEPSEEPSVARMAELTRLVNQKGINYIFFETLVSPRLAETIARETGAQTLVFDPLEGLSQESQDKGKDYLSVQYENLKNLKKALECS